MVTPSARRNRGQVILIGAITLAFILLGIVVVFNGVLYTETVSESSTSQSTADAEVVEQGVERNLVEIAHRWNFNESTDRSDFEDIGSGEFAYQYRDMTANSRSAITSVEDINIESDQEADVVSENDTTGNISFDSDSEIGYFVLNLNANDDIITVEANHSTGDPDITIQPQDDHFKLKEVSDCEVPAEQVRFNLITGQTNVTPTGSCDPETFRNELSIIESDKSYSDLEIEFSSGDDLGTYDIVTTGGSISGSDPGIWSFDITFTYESNQVSYKRTASTIEVYGDRR